MSWLDCCSSTSGGEKKNENNNNLINASLWLTWSTENWSRKANLENNNNNLINTINVIVWIQCPRKSACK